MSEIKENAVFTGLEQCSTATGIAIEMLRRAKTHPDGVDGTNGFHQSGRIYWNKLKPWIDEHGEELFEGNADEYFKWRALKMEFAAKAEQLAYEKERGKLVEIDVVNGMLQRLLAAQSSLMNSKFIQELNPRLDGMTEQQRQPIIEQAVQDYLKLVMQEIAKWKK